jgi:hypothetical protein
LIVLQEVRLPVCPITLVIREIWGQETALFGELVC